MPIISPNYFKHEELYISASLQAVVDGKFYDMTGRRYFNADLFGEEGVEVQTSKHMAQGIGFGITDINIDISTSLQPVIEITFKDLYGNTMFGGNNSQSIDYSVFFAWPPPKFKFTFKGYLGRQVTYMLSLKKYDISFNSDDASYSIKGVFVPHQWGFFADLPFSFILAAKALKKQAGLISEDDDENVGLAEEYKSSVQDIIEVGAEVDIATNQVSNKFDNLIGILNDLYSNAPVFSTSPSAFEKINGSVDGEQINNFISIQLDQAKIEQVDREVYKKGSAPGLLEYVLSKVMFNEGEKGPYFDNSLADFSNDTIINNDRKKEIRDRVFNVVKANQDEIQKDISAKRFSATAVKLNKLTISRVLNQLASDSAYVMGRILEAGIKGFEEFGDVRKEAVEQDNLIARHYPLIIDDEGQEVPAKNEFGIEESGNELDFVRIFTDAVVKGITDFQNVAAINPDEVTSDVAHPISTLEIFAPKPYAGAEFGKFGTDILARSAIAAWFTKNSDITLTGDADAEKIEALAEKDFQNITKSDLRRLSGGESGPRGQLKTFCTFWERLINQEGTQFLLPNGTPDDDVFDLADYLKTNVTDFVDESILNYRVVVDYGGKKTEVEQLRTQEELIAFAEANPEVDIRSVNDMLKDLFKGDLASIDPATMAGDHFMNNGIPYFTGAHKRERDFNTFWIAFEGEDAVAANQILSNSEGAVFITEPFESDGEELTDEVKTFNELVDDEIVFDYQKIRFKDSSRELNDNLTNFQTKSWTDSFASTQEYKDAFLMQRKIKPSNSDTGIEVNSQRPILYVKAFTLNVNAYKNTSEVIDDGLISFAADVVQGAADMAAWINSNNVPLQVAANWAASIDFVEPNERVAFDLFTGDRNGADNNGAIEGRYQRQYIRSMCVKILGLIQEIESEDNNVISQVLGNAQEGENVIYKQFHSLFQQWNSIAFQDDVDSAGDVVNSVVPSYRQLAEQLMREYGSCGFGNGLNTSDGDIVERALNSDQVTPRSGVFVYDFPLQRIKQAGQSAASSQIRVENALVNTDALTEARSDTTVLNVIQAICSKNNFMFIPIPGYTNYLDINDIYTPKNFDGHQRVVNFFHVMFIPTPESRALKPTDTYTTPAALARSQENLDVEALEVKYGSTQNNVVRNIQVSTQDNKVTAESVINLERLVNNENRNKTVTTDCSMLNVMAGRSYKATVDILGNAQVFPMQFFFIRNLPMFDGLYQILNVKHSITPNNFETSMEGMRMRFYSESDYGGVFPITIETLAKNAEERGIEQDEIDAENNESARDQIADIGVDDGESLAPIEVSSLDGEVSQLKVEVGPASGGFKNANRLKTSNDSKLPIKDNPGKASKESIIQSMNYFIRDIFEPWAAWLKQNHPQVYKQVNITSAIRNSTPQGGSSNSRHFYGQAIDFQIIKGNRIDEELDWNLRLFNTIMEWYSENPGLKYDQLLLETRNNRNSIWIHWAYNWEGENRGMRRRFKDDSTLWSADMNGVNKRGQVTRADAKFL